MTAQDFIHDMLYESFSVGGATLQEAYSYYTGFYTWDSSILKEVQAELIRANMVHYIDPNAELHVMKDMEITNAAVYYKRFTAP